MLIKILIARDVTSGCHRCEVKCITVKGEIATGPLSLAARSYRIFIILRAQASNIEHTHMSAHLFPESVRGTVAELRRCEHYNWAYVYRQ